MERAYAGIGSRETPDDVLELMKLIGRSLAKDGWILRSGAAPGADAAFEAGCDQVGGSKEIYIPWRGFQERHSGPEIIMSNARLPNLQQAYDLAESVHPNWARCTTGARKLHTRNCYQVLGESLQDPVRVVICWTSNGSGKGGTGQALRIARMHGIEIHDLGIKSVLDDYRYHFRKAA